MSNKRTDYISWDEFFMFSAGIAAQRSKDPSTQVGCVIVNKDNRIVSSGYNGFPQGMSDDVGLWGKTSPEPLRNKYMYVCHAEMNAIISSKTDCKGNTMYITHYPCHECAKMIIQAGIEKVVYSKDWGRGKETQIAGKVLFDFANVKVEKYYGSNNITLNV